MRINFKEERQMKDQDIFSLFSRNFGVLLLIAASLFVSVSAYAAADSFEPDNTLQNAKAILIHDPRPEFAEPGYDWIQSHNFYDVSDEDWVKFYGVKDEIYTVKVKEPGSNCNAVIGIYDKFGDLVIPEEVNDEPVGKEEYAEFVCKADGIYYARIRQSSGSGYGENTDYKLVLYIPIQEDTGNLYGTIISSVSLASVADATVNTTDGRGKSIYLGYNRETGYYSSPHPPGSFTLTVTATGYEEKKPENIYVNQFGGTEINIKLDPKNNEQPKYHSADSNQDCSINISEMLSTSQLCTSGYYHCDSGNSDGYAPGAGDRSCKPHDSDYAPQDWKISHEELSRITLFWERGGYHSDPWGEDGFAPGRQ
jgi:hypothetical protein